jgi:hypothetical protein
LLALERFNDSGQTLVVEKNRRKVKSRGDRIGEEKSLTMTRLLNDEGVCREWL